MSSSGRELAAELRRLAGIASACQPWQRAELRRGIDAVIARLERGA